MSTSAAPVRAQTSASRRVAQPGDVVDDPRARRDRGLRDRRLVGVDGDEHVVLGGDRARTSGTTRAISSSAGTGGRPPTADSPPTSMIAAPAAISARRARAPEVG